MDPDEAEFMENVFDFLCSALGEPEIKKLFLDSEGVDLMVLMLKYVHHQVESSTLTNETAGTKCRLGHVQLRC